MKNKAVKIAIAATVAATSIVGCSLLPAPTLYGVVDDDTDAYSYNPWEEIEVPLYGPAPMDYEEYEPEDDMEVCVYGPAPVDEEYYEDDEADLSESENIIYDQENEGNLFLEESETYFYTPYLDVSEDCLLMQFENETVWFFTDDLLFDFNVVIYDGEVRGFHKMADDLTSCTVDINEDKNIYMAFNRHGALKKYDAKNKSFIYINIEDEQPGENHEKDDFFFVQIKIKDGKITARTSSVLNEVLNIVHDMYDDDNRIIAFGEAEAYFESNKLGR